MNHAYMSAYGKKLKDLSCDNINKIRATIHPLHRAEPSNETQRVFACMTVCAQLPSANASQAYVSVDPAKGSVVELYD